jgi:hypothetical protein
MAGCVNYWILQANPKIYDAVTSLGDAGRLDRWRVSRYLKDLEPGNKFALWISGTNSGVYAFGVITGPVGRDKDPDPLWQDSTDGFRIDWRVGIRIEEILDNPIRRSDLLRDPGFANAAIMRMSGGGNPFPVTDLEWEILNSHRRLVTAP